MKKKRKRKSNVRFAATAIVLLLLVVIFAWTLKSRGDNTEVGSSVEQEVVDLPQTTEKEPEKQEEPEEEPEAEGQAVTEEEKEAQRASFLPDYESFPLLGTTPIKYLTIEQGGTPGEVNFNWFSPSGSAGSVVLYNTSTGNTSTYQARTAASATEAGYFYNKAQVTGLQENTTYAYKVGNDAGWSPEYQFKTKDFSGDYTFLVVSDAQIGQSQMEDVQVTIDRWDATVTRLVKYVPEAAFMAHLGDQVAAYNEPTHYSGFFEHLGLYQIPLVPVVGNHDIDNWDSGGGPWFYERYNVPNRSTIGCNWADTDGDYWLRYGNTLFMVLNTSTLYGKDVHAEFVDQACAANPDAKWKIIMEHYSAWSSAEKYIWETDGFRAHWAWLTANYGIDLFLSGHDHAYTRTAIIDGNCEPVEGFDYSAGGTAKNAPGSMFVTVGTASGCLYQPLGANVVAVKNGQPEVPTALRVDVTDTTLKVTAYLMDSWEVYDEYTLEKD